MAVIQVTQFSPAEFVTTANRALTVTVDLTSETTFSLYVTVTPSGQQFKAVRGQTLVFNVVKGDTVTAVPMGTGQVIVTTA